MKLLLKFKDGMTVAVDLGEDFTVSGEGNFLELIRKGKETNGDININNQIIRKYEELYSFEIIL